MFGILVAEDSLLLVDIIVCVVVVPTILKISALSYILADYLNGLRRGGFAKYLAAYQLVRPRR